MTLKDEIKQVAAKSKAWKYTALCALVVCGVLFTALGMPDYAKQAVELGGEVAVLTIQDGVVVDVSSTVPVSVTNVSQ